MLMHEWMRYRDQQIKRGHKRATAEETPDEVQTTAASAETTATEPTPAAPAAERPRTPRSDLHPSDFQSRRLEALLARQQRLPLEVGEEEQVSRRGEARPKENRDNLIQRLLDPVLSISEAATLLGVCSTSVRRYTNRGVLKCFRTPGNQRRFRLSDVLDFMETQQSLE